MWYSKSHMKGLLIDLSSDTAILGLTEKDQITKIQYLEGAKNLCSTFFPALQAFSTLDDLTYIAVGTGPGSYMGIRTATTIAKTLSFATGLPLIEFCSILAFIPSPLEGSFVFVGDAKMGELYIITGEALNGKIRSISKARLISPQELDFYTENKDFIIGKNHLLPQIHLEWVSSYVFDQWVQGKTLESSELQLHYLR